MNRTFLRQLLLSNTQQLLISAEGFTSAMMDAFPLIVNDAPTPSAFFFDDDPPTYKDLADKALAKIQQQLHALSEFQGVTLTSDFSSNELPEGSIAYHRIWGFITADSRWYFSSKQFERDILDAEANPAISCHFIHANSPGGEAWYLDRLSETMRSLSKPIITLVEQCNCSACYYITCHSNVIAALTANDVIGCIGTMIETYDFSGYYEKLGIKIIRETADKSDLKNKKYDDLRAGNPKRYIEDVLNPLTEQFLNEVRASRPELDELPEDDPVFRGETFDTAHAIEKKLIDGSMTFFEAIARAVDLGRNYTNLETLKKNALNYL